MSAPPAVATAPEAVEPRPPDEVLRFAAMGASFPTRLSFMPSLLRRLAREGWRIGLADDGLDAEGYGYRVYRAAGPERSYSLVAFSHRLAPEERNDRVIAEAWDATFALFDGEPGAADIERLAANVPRQEAGRFLPSELVLSRANRSVRMFDHTVDRLAQGQQPDRDLVVSIGYLMRTTAVYGNGKFGLCDRSVYAGRAELAGPFRAEFLAVYLIRCFTLDLVEHLARLKGGERAVCLAPELRRYLGIGNSTGLGMAPFLVNHPSLFSRWMAARETALARVRAQGPETPRRLLRLLALMERARRHLAEWRVEDEAEDGRIRTSEREMEELAAWAKREAGRRAGFWDALYRRAEAMSAPTRELMVSLILQPHGDLVDDLAETMSEDEPPPLDAAMRLSRLEAIVRRRYGWAECVDLSDPGSQRHFWYISAEKQEPRLGDRYEEPGAELEHPFAVARDLNRLGEAIAGLPGGASVASLLIARPDLMHAVRRVQAVDAFPYGEIHDNLVGAECRPIDLLRAKLAFFGAVKFDPKSDKWLRIALYQGAPLPDEIGQLTPDCDDWHLSALGDGG